MTLNLKLLFDTIWCISQKPVKDSRFLHPIPSLIPESKCSTFIVMFSFTSFLLLMIKNESRLREENEKYYIQ